MHLKTFGNKIGAMVALLLIASFFVSGSLVHAAAQTIVVTPADVQTLPNNTPPPYTKNWVAFFRDTGTYAFHNGPATPPLGNGSVKLKTTTGNDKLTLYNYNHLGVKLSDINTIGYSTYRTQADVALQVTALNIEVDVNGADPGGFTTLIFEPYYTYGSTAVNNVWQTWDAYKGGTGIWWSSNPIPAAPDRNTFPTWNAILAANPNAVIVGGFGINQGGGNPNLETAVDALKIGYLADSYTYNFELTSEPPIETQCAGLDIAQYNIATFKNTSLVNGGSEITGKVAVGGNASFNSYNIATQQPTNQPNLFVNGTLSLNNGQVRGQVVNNPTAFNAVLAENCAKLTSQYWKNQGGTAVASQWGGFYITAGSGTSYFKLKGSELFNANNLQITAPANATVILNIDGTNDRMQYMGFSLNGGISSNNVVLNFHDATSLLVNGIQVRGTVWAPYANVTFQNGALQGSLVAQSLTGGSTRFEYARFNGALPVSSGGSSASS